MAISPEHEYLTPRPTFVPDAKSADKPKRRITKVLSSTIALASVSTLCATLALPMFMPLPGDQDAPAASEQHLLSARAVGGTDSPLDAFGSVELGFDFDALQRIATEEGLVDPASLESTALRFPFDADWPLTDGFAYRVAPVEQFHDAQDIAAAPGTPVLAIGSGVVIEAGWVPGGCGFSTKLQHRVDGDTLTSWYCHMQGDSHTLKVGDTVNIGDQVGRVGNTGLSFGPHLHLVLRKNGESIDPLPYIALNVARETK